MAHFSALRVQWECSQTTLLSAITKKNCTVRSSLLFTMQSCNVFAKQWQHSLFIIANIQPAFTMVTFLYSTEVYSIYSIINHNHVNYNNKLLVHSVFQVFCTVQVSYVGLYTVLHVHVHLASRFSENTNFIFHFNVCSHSACMQCMQPILKPTCTVL